MTAFRPIFLLLAFVPAVARAQGRYPGASVNATPRLRSVVRVGDTTTISYSVLVSASSPDRLFGFTISLPSVSATVISPAPEPDWSATNSFEGRQVAGWWSMHTIAPGDSTPTLVFRGVGIAGQAMAWLTGDSATKIPGDDSTTSGGGGFLDSLSAVTTAVGIVPAPTDPSAIVTLLRTQSDTSCTLGWITSSTLCSTLYSEASTDDYASISAYGASLDSARSAGSAVSDAAFYLLKTNATYALAHIAPPALSAYITGDTATSIYTAHPSGGTPGYSYLWEWCAIDCGGGEEVRAPPGKGVHPNEVEHGWHSVGGNDASLCWTMSDSTLRLTVTDADSHEVIAYYTVPELEHVC